jgi:hypothetical protein
MELSETFWAGFYTFTGGFVLAVFAIAYKSKCDKVNVCWGGIEIHREVNVELQNDMKKLDSFQDAKEDDV